MCVASDAEAPIKPKKRLSAQQGQRPDCSLALAARGLAASADSSGLGRVLLAVELKKKKKQTEGRVVMVVSESDYYKERSSTSQY